MGRIAVTALMLAVAGVGTWMLKRVRGLGQTSASARAPSPLTALTEAAARRNHELGSATPAPLPAP